MEANFTMTNSISPFPNNLSFLDAEIRLLALRAKRIQAQTMIRDLNDAGGEPRRVGRGRVVAADESARVLRDLQKAETKLRDEIDQRVRGMTEPPGLVRIVQGLGLDERDTNATRLILTVLMVHAISPFLADEVLMPVELGQYQCQVDGLVRFCDPAEKTTTDWLRLRKILRSSGDLVSQGWVVLDFGSRTTLPGDMLRASVSLSAKAFAEIAGDESLLREGPGGGER